MSEPQIGDSLPAAGDAAHGSAPETRPTPDSGTPTNVLIVGVGGQGVILISKMLARVCQRRGFQVKQSEVHGMAKRGGVVFSHVRYGKEVWSPTIPAGEVDVLVALEWAEGQRWLPFLRAGSGTLICDTQRIVPPFAFLDRKRGALPQYAPASVEAIARLVPNSYAIDATDLAKRIGNARIANTVLLGILSASLPFPVEEWLEVVQEFVPPRTIELNRRALLEGRAWAEQAHAREPQAAPAEAAASAPAPAWGPATLEIIAAWCKGCDICVKMCPERCLRLNAHQVVELTDPALCTGCRICEQLCPDFAITVNT
ncbi:MAG: 2-oxoacid:acceptor oxidoreductase family protein [Candidatus Lambdaproteobacteria bacterium]|nr:2-oxoacid:acceptor oxidoreductase family protein [Candidatus Lambdaproteobacteria bacterium]